MYSRTEWCTADLRGGRIGDFPTVKYGKIRLSQIVLQRDSSFNAYTSYEVWIRRFWTKNVNLNHDVPRCINRSTFFIFTNSFVWWRRTKKSRLTRHLWSSRVSYVLDKQSTADISFSVEHRRFVFHRCCKSLLVNNLLRVQCLDTNKTYKRTVYNIDSR